MLSLGTSLILLVVVALLSVYLTKIDLVDRLLGGLDSFWEERALWSRRPRRQLKRPGRSKRKARRQTRAEEEAAAKEAAEKAARWPYE